MPAVKPPAEGGVPAPDLTQSIITVEKASNRTLPSTVSAALAASGLDGKSLTRAAQIVAKSFDLDPAYFWGSSTITDPYTGGPLSLATFRRLTEDVKPSVLEAMAPNLFRPTAGGERVAERPWLTNMNAKRVSSVIREAGPVLAPFHIAAHEGIALASEVLRKGANPKRFAANLKTILDWYALDKNTLMKGRELDWVGLANLALEAAAAKRDLTTAMDVRAFLFPEIADQAKRGSRAEANAAASESWAMYGGGRGTAWLNEASDLTPTARAFLAGDYTNPEVKKFLDEKFGNAEELAKAREVLMRQALIEQARKAQAEGNVVVAGLTGGRGAVDIPDAEGLAEARELLSRGSPDWFKGAELLQQEVIDSKTAFQRSFVGGALMGALDLLGEVYEQGQRLIINTAALSVPVARALGADDFADEGAVVYATYLQRIEQGHGIGETMAQKYGWHPAVGAGFDFLAGIATDPFIWAGRGLTGYRSLRYAPGLVEKRGVVQSLLAKVPVLKDYLTARSKRLLAEQALDFETVARGYAANNAERLAKAMASGDPGKIREFIQDFGTHIHTGAALDESLLQKAQRLFTQRYPMVTQDAVKEAEHLLQSLFGIKVRPGSLAEGAWMTRASAETSAISVADQMPTIQGRVYAQSETGLLLPEATAKELVDDAIRQHVLNPGQLEVPYRLRPVPGFGLRRSLQNTLRGTDIVNEGILSGAQRTLAKTFGLNPGNVLNLNEDPSRWARLVAVRSGEFSPRQVDSIVDAMNKAVIGGNPEVAVERVVQKQIIDPVIKAEAARMNLPESLIPAVREEMDRAFGKWRQELFGVVDGKNVRSPLLETQRVNELVFPDVLQVKKFVRTFANAHLDLLESAPNALRLYATRSADLWAKHAGPVARAVMRTWKTLVVPRGGYVGRVVLLDEGLGRWFGTGFSLMERVASTNVDEAVAALVKAGTLGLTPKPVARAIGKAVGKPVEAVSDWLYYVDEFKLGDDVVPLKVPRTSISYEPLANTVSRPSEVIEDVMKRSAQVQKDLKFRGHWGIVEPKNTTYYPALQHALNNQIAQSIPGRLALEAVRDGKSVVETQALLLAWARRNGKSYLAQMGWAAEDAAEWATLTAKLVHGYTVGRKEIAAIALERGITEDVLRKIPRDALPNVHGPLLQEATFGNSALNLKGLTEYWYDTFVRLPENTLNRQPYYRAWKRRAERAYYALAEDQSNAATLLLDDEMRALGFSSVDDALERTATRVVPLTGSDDLARQLERALPYADPDSASVAGRSLNEAAEAIYGKDVVYRGMSLEEWTQAQSDGFFQGAGVQKARTGETYFAETMSQASGYTSRRYSAAFGARKGFGSAEERVIVVLRDPGNLRDLAWNGLRAREPVAFDNVVGAYRISMRRGAQDDLVQYLRGQFSIAENVADEDVLRDVGRILLDDLRRTDPGAWDEIASTITDEGLKAEARNYADYYFAHYTVTPVTELQFPHALAEQVASLSAEARNALVPLDELKAAIDQASRDFALKQVKRIMFDFSENSRLGELLYGVFPFLQPYAEAFSVYGHILWHRNPALLGYANRLWDAGRQSGFIQKDEQSGEWVIPTSWWSAGSTIMQTWGNIPGARLFTPVRSLNLFASSTLRLPDEVPLAGGASIPVPSLPPWALYVLQKAFKDTESDVLASYLFAYGPNVQVVPNALNRFLIASFPEMYDEGLLNSIAMDYLIDYQYRGIYQDLGVEQQKAQALKDARDHMMARAFLAFNGIGISLVRWEWSPIRQEYFDLVEQNDGNTLKAREEFLKKYPDFSAMTVGKTEVGPGLSFVDEKGDVIPNAAGLRLPATDYARRFLNSPAGKELIAQGFTPLLGALLLQTETAQDNDFATYSQYLSQGLVKTKDLVDYIADVEQVGLAGVNPRVVEEHEGFWGAVISWTEWKRAQQDRLKAEGYSEDSEAFDNLDREEDDFLLSVKDHFPASFKEYFKVSSDGERVSWRSATNDAGEPDPLTLAKIRQFADLDQIQDFNAVKGLNVFFPEFDRIRATMIAEGINSIDDTGAKELGLDKQYEDLLARLERDYPEAAYIVNSFLRNVLVSEPTKGEQTLAGWQDAGDPRYQQYRDFEDRYTELSDQLDPTDRDYETSFIYTQMSDLISQEYLRNPEIIQAWWERKTYGQRASYRDNLITKYVGYMNLWDLHLFGFDVSAQTAEQMRSVALRRVAASGAAYEAERAGQKFDVGAAYDAIGQDELRYAQANPEYAQVLNAQRTWGWALERSEYVQGDHRAAYLWRNFLTALRSVQKAATDAKLTGTEYGSQENKTAYIRLREVLITIKKAYYETDDRFRAEWEYLDNQVSGPLINYFMPDFYFDYPLGPVSPRQAA